MAVERAFLKISGINGTSKDPLHPHWIEIESFQVDANSFFSAGDSARRTERNTRSIAESVFIKRVDATSASLHDAMTKRTRFVEAILETALIDDTARRNYLRVRYKDVVVLSFRTLGKSDSDFPLEEFTIGFANRETGRF